MNVQARTAYMEQIIKANRNATVPWFLMTSWLYYIQDISLVSDTSFDALTRLMTSEWLNIEHRHKQLITLDMLRAGTAFNLRDEDYPTITKTAATRLATEDGHFKFSSKSAEKRFRAGKPMILSWPGERPQRVHHQVQRP